jgi:hypothetical protein
MPSEIMISAGPCTQKSGLDRASIFGRGFATAQTPFRIAGRQCGQERRSCVGVELRRQNKRLVPRRTRAPGSDAGMPLVSPCVLCRLIGAYITWVLILFYLSSANVSVAMQQFMLSADVESQKQQFPAMQGRESSSLSRR